MPNLVFLTLGAGLAIFAWKRTASKDAIDETESEETPDDAKTRELEWSDVVPTGMLDLEVGYGLIALVDANRGGKLPDRIRAVRRKLTEQLGFLVAPVHIRDNLDLEPTRYRIKILGVVEGEADIYPDRELAMGGLGLGNLPGIATNDPAYGMEAVWIEPGMAERARATGYTVVDAGTVIATHLSKLVQQHAGSLLGHQEVQELLDVLSKSAPRLVEDLVPKSLALPVVVKVMQNLLEEGIPLRDLRTIAETLAEKGANTTDVVELTAAVRVALRRLITSELNGFADTLPVITLDAELEQLCLKSVESGGAGGLGIEPMLAERLHESLADSVRRQDVNGEPAVLLVNPALRPSLAALIRQTVPLLKVLAYNEIAETKRLKVIANIGGDAPAIA
jgi:flagellar biosynthesis protein FlhA